MRSHDRRPSQCGGAGVLPGPPCAACWGSTVVSRFGAGIRRGVMAGDQFTQIANALFRDTQLSFKAKGMFGMLSTHREGWRMTVADIARRGRDGEAAVKSGLKELEKHGFLVRERERDHDSTLGAAAYVITDLPALQNPRPQPESGFPPVDNPTSVNRPTKNTIVKKTDKQKTHPIRPCGRDAAARTNGGPCEATTVSAPPPAADDMHPGIRLLLEIGASRPELLLTGKPLTDQRRVVTVMPDAGWSPAQLRHIITARPLPHPVRTSVGAITAARLRAAQAYPQPGIAASHHDTPAGDDPRPTTSAAARTVCEALTYRALVECAGCGVPGTAPSEDLCRPASAGHCAAPAQAPLSAAPAPKETAAAPRAPQP